MIHPYGLQISVVNDSSEVDAAIFRADIDIYKTASVMAIDRYDDEGNLVSRRGFKTASDIQPKSKKLRRSKSLKIGNPQNKLYMVFVTVNEVASIEGPSFGQKVTVRTPLTICIATQYPYFSLFFKLLSMLMSKLESLSDCTKTARSQAYLANNSQLTATSDIEGLALLLATDCKSVVDKVLELEPEKDASGREVVRLELEFDKVEFVVPNGGLLMFAESIYFFEPLLRSLDFDDFYFVLCCMLLEKSIIFVSTSMQRLCSAW